MESAGDFSAPRRRSIVMMFAAWDTRAYPPTRVVFDVMNNYHFAFGQPLDRSGWPAFRPAWCLPRDRGCMNPIEIYLENSWPTSLTFAVPMYGSSCQMMINWWNVGVHCSLARTNTHTHIYKFGCTYFIWLIWHVRCILSRLYLTMNNNYKIIIIIIIIIVITCNPDPGRYSYIAAPSFYVYDLIWRTLSMACFSFTRSSAAEAEPIAKKMNILNYHATTISCLSPLRLPVL